MNDETVMESLVIQYESETHRRMTVILMEYGFSFSILKFKVQKVYHHPKKMLQVELLDDESNLEPRISRVDEDGKVKHVLDVEDYSTHEWENLITAADLSVEQRLANELHILIRVRPDYVNPALTQSIKG